MLGAHQALRLAIDPSVILEAQGLTPDPWQRTFLLCEDRSILKLCSRGAGKSRSTSAKALHTALFRPKSLVLLISRSQRQSFELFRYVKQGYAAVDRPIPAVRETLSELELENGSRVVCLPSNEETIRGYQGVSLLIEDEAARIPDDLHKSVTPMVAVSKGQQIALTTPWGQRGWFWKAWESSELAARRFKITWDQCPRHTKAFIDRERTEHGDSWVKQEYECSFESLSGLVYPDFASKVHVDFTSWPGLAVGGIDFGYRNPFAAVWGAYDRHTQRLTIEHERYRRETPLHEHAAALPKNVVWWADPSHPTEITQLRTGGFTIKRSINDIAAGITVVRMLIETGRLKVCGWRCPNLMSEAQLYRYATQDEGRNPGEVPVDEHNHALAALRYLCVRLFPRLLATARMHLGSKPGAAPEEIPELSPETREACFVNHQAKLALPRHRPTIMDPNDEDLWYTLN